MSVTIELKPEIEAQVKTEAAARGLLVEDYLEAVIESQLANGAGGQRTAEISTPAQRARAWEEWAAGHNPDTPVILNDSREAIYGDDGR
jgi:hypothetical protein